MTLMHDRPLVYVAGPYTNPDPIRNTHDAVRWAEKVMRTGELTAFVPHLSLLWHMVSPHDDVEFWYEFDLTMLARCDAVFRFPGASSGADREVAFAYERGIPVYTSLELLRAATPHLLALR